MSGEVNALNNLAGEAKGIRAELKRIADALERAHPKAKPQARYAPAAPVAVKSTEPSVMDMQS